MTITPGSKRSKPTLEQLVWLGWLLQDSIETNRSIPLRAFCKSRGLPATTVGSKLRSLSEHFEDMSDPSPRDHHADSEVHNLLAIDSDGCKLTEQGCDLAMVGLILSSCLALLRSEVPRDHRRRILRKAFQQITGDTRGIESIVRMNRSVKAGSMRRFLGRGDMDFEWLVRKPTKLDAGDAELWTSAEEDEED